MATDIIATNAYIVIVPIISQNAPNPLDIENIKKLNQKSISPR
jgi:methyltransferase-like protein